MMLLQNRTLNSCNLFSLLLACFCVLHDANHSCKKRGGAWRISDTSLLYSELSVKLNSFNNLYRSFCSISVVLSLVSRAVLTADTVRSLMVVTEASGGSECL